MICWMSSLVSPHPSPLPLEREPEFLTAKNYGEFLTAKNVRAVVRACGTVPGVE